MGCPSCVGYKSRWASSGLVGSGVAHRITHVHACSHRNEPFAASSSSDRIHLFNRIKNPMHSLHVGNANQSFLAAVNLR